MTPPIRSIGLVAVGGAVGALARWGVGTLTADPLATLAVNVLGSFLLAGLLARRLPGEIELVVGTGFCSSFTTYSALAVETLALGPVGGVGYLAATYLLGVLAAGLATWEAAR